MANITDRYQPSFARWLIQNNRTGLQPVNIPLVLVVPFSVDPASGASISDASVSNLRFFIEEAPGLVPVAGFQNAGIFIPALERFVREVTTQELLNVKIDLSGATFYDQTTGDEKDFADAVDGDLFEYTLIRGLVETTGTSDRIAYHPDTFYYDLSPFTIATAELKPYGNYGFTWQCNYFRRIITPEGELFCIETSTSRLARFSLPMAHPGEVHRMMMENTPAVYFDGAPLDQDNLVKFYRPFADSLQDIFDEQSLMVGVNFIEKIPAQFIPYLAYLIGWDLPFFPGSTDKIRRAVLRNARRLQQLKGSRRVIRELFELFGYTIDVINLWYSQNGDKFIGPDEIQVEDDEEITTSEVCQTEILLADYETDGFGKIEIPLLFRPNPDEDITIDAWLVENDTTAADQMAGLLDALDIDPEGLAASVCPTDSGFLVSQPLQDQITGDTLGHSRVLVSQKFGGLDEIRTDDAPLSVHGLKYDRDRNILVVTFDHYIKFEGKMKLYAFATYRRNKINVPPTLTDLRSNRFDIQVLFNRTTGEAPDSHLLEFLLDFVFKLKAFHSILRKIVFTVPVTDVYNVIDFCLSGSVSQAPGTDLGELQTLPPVIPTDPGVCSPEAFSRGFKDSDLALRAEILAGLKAEHAAWKALDGTRDVPTGLDPVIESLSRITQNVPSGDECQFTQYGQDRVVAAENTSGTVIKDFDHVEDDREKLCDETNNSKLDNCFKGRAKQELTVERRLVLPELVRSKPCTLMGGMGFYYFNPERPRTLATNEIDTSDISNLGRGFLTDLIIRATANTDYVHYTTSPSLRDVDIFTNDQAAIRRPSLDIQKDNMFFPGHRFVTMGNLLADFEHTTYGYRPWDSQFDPLLCVQPPGATITDLDPTIEIGTDGEEYLYFNHIAYKLYGNGLVPDISSMFEHEDIEYLVTHSIYSNVSEHEYTAGVAIDHSASGLVLTSLASVCFGNDYGPIFKSANRDCPCNPSESYVAGVTDVEGMDYIDGYPAEYGRYALEDIIYDHGTGGSEVSINDALGIPGGSGSAQPTELLFKMGSGIRIETPLPGHQFWTPYRLDCGCAYFDCGSVGETVPHVEGCIIDHFRDDEGIIDPEYDKLTVESTLLLVESQGAAIIRMGQYPQSAADGYAPIPNMLSFDPAKLTLVTATLYPPSGDFMFVDSAGIIHEGSFERDDTRIDITSITRDPRVWGEDPTGVVNGTTVYRRGVVTTCRQILELTDTGSNILASGCTQTIETFQTTFGCRDRRPLDPFIYHLETGLVDDLEIEITCGPGFDSGDTVWCSIVEDSDGVAQPVGTGEQCMFWTDVWGNSESVTTVCPTASSGT